MVSVPHKRFKRSFRIFNGVNTHALSEDDFCTFTFVLSVCLEGGGDPHCDVTDDEEGDQFSSRLQELMSPLVAASSEAVRQEQCLDLSGKQRDRQVI